MGKRKRAVPPEECPIPSKRITRSASRLQRELGAGGNSAAVVPPPPPGRGAGGPSGSSSSNFNSVSQSQDPPGREELPQSNSPHPLYNQVILSKLFSLCSHESLATCRLVCRTWRDTSLPTWTSTSMVKISEEDYALQLGITRTGRNCRTNKAPLNDFLNSLETDSRSRTATYRHFHLENLDFGMSTVPEGLIGNKQIRKEMSDRIQKEIDHFLELVGASATSLTLERCLFPNAETLGKVLYQSFPNLESLTLSNVYGRITKRGQPSNVEQPEYYAAPPYGEHLQLKSLTVTGGTNMYMAFPVPFPWIELLSHFSSLTSLKLHFPPRCEHDYRYSYPPPLQKVFKKQVAFLLKAIQLIRSRDGSKLPLTDFDIDPAFGLEVSNSEFSTSVSNLIRALKLPQKSAKIRFDCKMNQLKELVEVHGGTLTKLDALMDRNDEAGLDGTEEVPGNPSTSFPCSFPFGNMLENLQELTISNRFTTNLEFLRYTPNLKRLRIFDGVINYKELEPLTTNLVSNTPKTEMEHVRLVNLKQLYLGYVITPDDLRCLVTWLPNVEMLSMLLDNEQFSIVCEGWRDLHHLHCLGRELSDQGITGVTNSGGEGNSAAIRPNITFLTKLTCFKTPVNRIKVTESMVHDGFLKLPKLRILDVTSSDSHSRVEAFENMRKLIREKLPNCFYCSFHMPGIRTRGPGYPPSGVFENNSCGFME